MTIMKKTSTVYIIIISLLGISTFISFYQFPFHPAAGASPAILLTLIGAIVLLNHYPIPIPPTEDYISMDSAIYLATLYLFGLNLTLDVLLFSSILYAVFKWRIAWWRHVFNFSIYSLMIIVSNNLFLISGGEVGAIQTSNLFPYVFSLSLYFLINMLLTGYYFFFAKNENSISFLRNLLIGKTFLVSYSNTLLFSLVLGILFYKEGILGLFMFVCIAMLLSIAFSQNLQLFQAVSDRAQKDFLTGLHNHGHFKEVLEKEIACAKEHGHALCLALIDLDDFKKYNDSFGHIKGDNLLKTFGKLVESYAPPNYHVARYGGEEFAVLMPKTSKDEAYSFLDGLRQRTNDTYFWGTEVLPYSCLSFSAGIAQFEKETYNASELLNRADQVMYYSKAQGKNMVHVYNEHSEDLVYHSLSIEKELEKVEQLLKIFLAKDVYSYSHSKRVYQYAVLFAQKLGLSDHEREIFAIGALAHDIGKIEVPRDILSKKGPLDSHEWEIVRKHVIWGKDLLSTNKNLEEIIPMVEYHHERYDGKGYPYGLKGENIPKLARLLSIINSFDTMTSDLPYQKARPIQEALEELRACSGQQFDPQYIEPFIQLIEERGQTPHLTATR